jgi:hypothetical protein
MSSSMSLKNQSESSGVDVLARIVDKDKERALIWKIDLHLLPYVSLLYVFSFLDRVNIGTKNRNLR